MFCLETSIKCLTCKGLVPLADTIWFSTKPLNVFQIGFRVKKPLCLWWRGDEHGSCGLLHNRLTRWALAGVRRGGLLSWWAKDSYLQWQSNGEITSGENALHICASSHPHTMELLKQVMSKGVRKFSWKTPTSARAICWGHWHAQRGRKSTQPIFKFNRQHWSYF